MKTLSRTARTWLVCAAYLVAGAGALVLLTPYANAQALPSQPSTWPHVPAQSGNTWTYGTGSATSANASTISFPPPANGSIYSESRMPQPLGGGTSVPVTARARPAPADIGRAVGRFLGRASGALVIGAAAYQLCNELGFECNTLVDGAFGVGKQEGTCTAYHSSFRLDSTVSGASCSALPAMIVDLLISQGKMSEINRSRLSCNSDPIPYCTINGENPFRFTQSPTEYKPKTIKDLEDAITAKVTGWPSNSALPKVLEDALKAGSTLPLPAPYEVTGPASVPLPPTTTTRPDGSSITDTPRKVVSYGPNSVTVTDESVKTETSSGGVTSPVSTATSPAPLPAPTVAPPAEVPQTCGYPGGPACKIDETGTPDPLPKGEYAPAAEEYKTKADENRQTIGGNGDKPFFSGWNLFFFAPSIAPCEPMRLPDFGGKPMGELDACNVVDGTRSVMSYIWALTALFLCLGMIKKVA